jgi:predicted RNase H-like nuclease (RuvC/YqgF family)
MKTFQKAILILAIISMLFYSSNVLAFYNRTETENSLQGICSKNDPWSPSITGKQSIANAICFLREGINELKNEIEQIKAENQALREEIGNLKNENKTEQIGIENQTLQREIDNLKDEISTIRKIVITFQKQIIEIQKIVIRFAQIFLK